MLCGRCVGHFLIDKRSASLWKKDIPCEWVTSKRFHVFMHYKGYAWPSSGDDTFWNCFRQQGLWRFFQIPKNTTAGRFCWQFSNYAVTTNEDEPDHDQKNLKSSKSGLNPKTKYLVTSPESFEGANWRHNSKPLKLIQSVQEDDFSEMQVVSPHAVMIGIHTIIHITTILTQMVQFIRSLALHCTYRTFAEPMSCKCIQLPWDVW